MPDVENMRNITVEAGELHVTRDDSILPTKLKLLGIAGWSVVDAWRLPDGGFNLLLTRPKGESIIEGSAQSLTMDLT